MNTILRFQVTVVFCIILMTSYFVMAKQQTITFEMGEGAHTITFPMTEKELKAHKKYQKQIKAIVERNKKNEKSIEGLEIVEMADGHTVTF